MERFLVEAHCSRSYRERYEFKIRYELELVLEGREGGDFSISL